jgi:hypothetical protein
VEFAAKVFPTMEAIKSAGVQTLRTICDCLNRSGISCRNQNNWHPPTIRNILKIQTPYKTNGPTPRLAGQSSMPKNDGNDGFIRN